VNHCTHSLVQGEANDIKKAECFISHTMLSIPISSMVDSGLPPYRRGHCSENTFAETQWTGSTHWLQPDCVSGQFQVKVF